MTAVDTSPAPHAAAHVVVSELLVTVGDVTVRCHADVALDPRTGGPPHRDVWIVEMPAYALEKARLRGGLRPREYDTHSDAVAAASHLAEVLDRVIVARRRCDADAHQAWLDFVWHAQPHPTGGSWVEDTAAGRP